MASSVAARFHFPPHGTEQGLGPCVQGWTQPDFWQARCIPAWLSFSARRFLCLSDACKAAKSASLSLCSLLSAICPSAPAPAQPVAEARGPHPPSSPSLGLVSAVKLSPPQRTSSAQANLQQHPRSPLPRANPGSAQRWQLSPWDFWTVFLPAPSRGVPGRVFAAPSSLGAVHPSALPHPRSVPGAGSSAALVGAVGLAPCSGHCDKPGSAPGPQPSSNPRAVPGCVGSPPKGGEQRPQVPAKREPA